jgi:hypothetical protein
VLYSMTTPPPLVDRISEEFRKRDVIVKADPISTAVETVEAASRVVAVFGDDYHLVNASV